MEVSFESEISAAIENLGSVKSLVSERLSNGSNGTTNGTVKSLVEGAATPDPTTSSSNQSKSPDSDDIRVMQMVLANEVSR